MNVTVTYLSMDSETRLNTLKNTSKRSVIEWLRIDMEGRNIEEEFQSDNSESSGCSLNSIVTFNNFVTCVTYTAIELPDNTSSQSENVSIPISSNEQQNSTGIFQKSKKLFNPIIPLRFQSNSS
uniref:Uncharacterized protein n=1 Tax=Timspurckia oligopyrenoides TaxID=708627 RepID=A0A6T6LYQ5_9RHOD|mmetsp:Transcript_266/g.476  ORF Transcript_266/g.476 Transcript_266/m.476 type:complete len:124 (+) Transcript_266:492-863(+)|eukprot:CAMPEP_0182446034 /NCGR_PEP_ID=MMETSP1172-20130603/3944_1 /TAXON_ID=708627 /ORGANISM="Timspurckia oligopyrenoides, Strain CCMP3278" /LENGTH=123 /DNA_ID=CAMNT_0024641895 /DNA_START=413 /DNA_END=784 /DNA_ORIENTATION=-